MKKKIFLFLTIVFAFCLFYLVAEAIVRGYNYLNMSSSALILSKNEILAYEHKPSITFVNKYHIKMRHNSLGFLGEEIGEKKEGEIRILGIGDSVGEAVYLPEEKRYLNLLADLIKVENGKRVNIINASVGGYNTQQELELIKEKGLNLKPDLIIIGMCLNDYANTKPGLKKDWLGRVIEPRRDNSQARYFNFLYQHSDLYKFIYDFLFRLKRQNLVNKTNYDKFLKNYPFSIKEKDWDTWRGVIEETRNLCIQKQVKLMFIIFPLRNQLAKGETVSYPPLVNFLKSKNVLFLDLSMPIYIVLERGDNPYNDRDLMHFNALGNRIIADEVAGYINQHGLLKQ